MKKKITLSLALVATLLVYNPAVVLAENPPSAQGEINGVTVRGNSTAYVASGSSSTYMATYCPTVSVRVDGTYYWYNVDNGQYYFMYPSSAGTSSVLVIADPNNEFCVSEYMEAHHYASDGIHAPWEKDTHASFY